MLEMAISISNATSASPIVPTVSAQAGTSRESHTATSARATTDTVKLSQSGQIHAMKQQGQGASQIASALGVSISSVDSVLGIVVAAAAVVEATPIAATVVNTKSTGTPAPALIDVRG
jgi:hypothetical protein